MSRDERYHPNGPYLEKVSARIGHAVMAFYELRLTKRSCRFYADELRKWVYAQVAIAAPGSADRILRDLRQKGRLDYVLISRSKSLYEFRPLGPKQQEFRFERTPSSPANYGLSHR